MCCKYSHAGNPVGCFSSNEVTAFSRCASLPGIGWLAPTGPETIAPGKRRGGGPVAQPGVRHAGNSRALEGRQKCLSPFQGSLHRFPKLRAALRGHRPFACPELFSFRPSRARIGQHHRNECLQSPKVLDHRWNRKTFSYLTARDDDLSFRTQKPPALPQACLGAKLFIVGALSVHAPASAENR